MARRDFLLALFTARARGRPCREHGNPRFEFAYLRVGGRGSGICIRNCVSGHAARLGRASFPGPRRTYCLRAARTGRSCSFLSVYGADEGGSRCSRSQRDGGRATRAGGARRLHLSPVQSHRPTCFAQHLPGECCHALRAIRCNGVFCHLWFYYSLHDGQSRLPTSVLSRFLLRRLARLEPPYLASIAFVLLLGIASAAAPGFREQPFEWSAPQILSHAGYLTGLAGHQWLNIVYWTLAIEFQFYILIAIFFPLLATRRSIMQVSAIMVCAAAPLLTPRIPAPTADAFFPTLILPLLPAFAAGVLTFKLLTGRAQAAWYWPALVILTGLIAWRDGTPFGVSVGATGAVIATVHLPRIRPLAYLGAISYSLYLVHVPISVRLSNLASHLGSSLALEIAVIFAALGVCIAAATIFHWLVERPSVELAARIAYR